MKILLGLIAILMAILVFMVYRNLTTPAGLGVVDGKLSTLPSSPNAISSQTDRTDRQVAPLPFIEDLQASKSRLITVLQNDVSMTIVTENEIYIHAISTTPTLGFRDDLEFYFDENNQVIHLRSASRVGYSDGGLNRRRYEQLHETYLNGTE